MVSSSSVCKSLGEAFRTQKVNLDSTSHGLCSPPSGGNGTRHGPPLQTAFRAATPRWPSFPRCFYCRRRPFCTVATHRRAGYPGVVNPIYCEAAGKREKEAPCTARWTICSAAVVIWEYDGGGCVHFLPAVFSSLRGGMRPMCT